MPVKCFHIVTMETLEWGGPLLFPSKKRGSVNQKNIKEVEAGTGLGI